MIRVIEAPNNMKRTVYVEETNHETGFNELKPLMDGDDVVTEDILMFTMVETFEVTAEVNELNEELETSTLIEKKRVMPNGDYYVINGNIELYVPINSEPKKYTETEQLGDAVTFSLSN